MCDSLTQVPVHIAKCTNRRTASNILALGRYVVGTGTYRHGECIKLVLASKTGSNVYDVVDATIEGRNRALIAHFQSKGRIPEHIPSGGEGRSISYPLNKITTFSYNCSATTHKRKKGTTMGDNQNKGAGTSESNLKSAKDTDKRKQSLYFPESMLQEIKEEAARLDRSLSWVVQRCWKIARQDLRQLPSVTDIEGDEEV